MIFDLDDLCTDADSGAALGLLYQLKAMRPDFKATLFAIPGRCLPILFDTMADWLELAVHGWMHPDPHECQDWSRERMLRLMDEFVVKDWFVQGFKAPGWQISDGCYEALLERDWWVADQPYNDARRPLGLRCHLLGSPDHWHGHVNGVGVDNGIRDTWGEVQELVREAESFEFMSEVVAPWIPVGAV